MTVEESELLLQKALDMLGEHFEAVQINATWTEQGMTIHTPRGCGNWHARQGMAHEFINMSIANDAAEQIAQRLKTEGD